METRLGRVVKLAPPSHGLAWMQDSNDPNDGWFLDCRRRGTVAETENGPELAEGTGNYSKLPIPGESVYALVEGDNAVAIAWVPQIEYDASLTKHKDHQRSEAEKKKREQQALELVQQQKRQVIERKRKELAERPILRVMEQMHRKKVPTEEPRIILGPRLRHDFLREYPFLRKTDKFTTSGDFLETRKRWFEYLTINDEGIEEWVTGDDPRSGILINRR